MSTSTLTKVDAFDGYTCDFAVEGFIVTDPDGNKTFVAWEDYQETEFASLIKECLDAEAALEAWQERRWS